MQLDRDAQQPTGVHLNKRWSTELPDFWSEVVAPMIRIAMVQGIISGQLRLVNGHWLFGGEALCQPSAQGQLLPLLNVLQQRSDIVRAIGEGYTRVRHRDLTQYGSRLQFHEVIKTSKKVPGANANVLALAADIFAGSNQTLGPRIALTTTVFEATCKVIRDYHHETLPSAPEADLRARRLLSGLDEKELQQGRRKQAASAEVTAMWESLRIIKESGARA
jgi:hypothetical protein